MGESLVLVFSPNGVEGKHLFVVFQKLLKTIVGSYFIGQTVFREALFLAGLGVELCMALSIDWLGNSIGQKPGPRGEIAGFYSKIVSVD